MNATCRESGLHQKPVRRSISSWAMYSARPWDLPAQGIGGAQDGDGANLVCLQAEKLSHSLAEVAYFSCSFARLRRLVAAGTRAHSDDYQCHAEEGKRTRRAGRRYELARWHRPIHKCHHQIIVLDESNHRACVSAVAQR